jgi:hypothetical protein
MDDISNRNNKKMVQQYTQSSQSPKYKNDYSNKIFALSKHHNNLILNNRL